jgi:hypothetical protein
MRRLKRWLLPLLTFFAFASMVLGWWQRTRSARPRAAVASPVDAARRR